MSGIEKAAPVALPGFLSHWFPQMSINVCLPVMTELGLNLERALESFGHSGLTSYHAEEYNNGKIGESFGLISPNAKLDSEHNRYLLRQIIRLRLYLAVLIEKLSPPSNLFHVTEEMRSWNIALATASQGKYMDQNILSQFISVLDLNLLVEEDFISSLKAVLKLPRINDDIENFQIIEAGNDIHFTSERVSLISSYLSKRILELCLCSRLLMGNMLSVSPSSWDDALTAIIKKIFEYYFVRLINCFGDNFTSLGILVSKEVCFA